MYGVSEGDKAIPAEWGRDYCVVKKTPWVFVTPENKYAHISIDLNTVDDGLTFPDDRKVLDLLQEYYKDYRVKASFPEDKWSFTGSATSFGIFIWTKDYKEFVPKFFEYIMETIDKHGVIDELYSEYTKVIRSMNAMTTRKAPYNKEKMERLEKRRDELSGKIKERK